MFYSWILSSCSLISENSEKIVYSVNLWVEITALWVVKGVGVKMQQQLTAQCKQTFSWRKYRKHSLANFGPCTLYSTQCTRQDTSAHHTMQRSTCLLLSTVFPPFCCSRRQLITTGARSNKNCTKERQSAPKWPIKIPFQCLNSATEPFSFLWTEKPSSLCTNFFDLGVKVVSCFIRCFAVYCLYCWYLWLRARTVTSCPRLRLVVQHKENKKVGWSVFVWQVWSEELAISGQPVGLLCSG